MPTEAKLLTAEELLAMPDDGNRYELVNGELITMSPAGYDHAVIGNRIATHLTVFAAQNKLGEVAGSSAGYLIARNPDTVLEPDASFVRAERVVRTDKYFPGPPDLAIEVISPNDTYGEVDTKVGMYLAAGTRMVIVVNPRNVTVSVNTPRGATRLTIDDTLSGGDVVPGWSLPLRELFA